MMDFYLVAALILPIPLALLAMHVAPDRVRRVAATAGAILFYGPGYIAGAGVRFVRWARAAIVAGYKDGKGAT